MLPLSQMPKCNMWVPSSLALD